jgi:ESCRT-II complex subunit VPS22
MRRNRLVGIGALQKDKQRLELFQQKGTVLAKEELDQLSIHMGKFKNKLEEFAKKHTSEIKGHAKFRREFQEMCAVAGVDPLRSSSNFLTKLLGVGDYYFELAIQIVEIFLSTNHKRDGIMPIEELRERLLASRNVSAHLRTTDSITKSDILEAIKKLKVLGSNIQAVPTKDNSYVIHASPAELSSSHVDITQIAHSNKGYVSRSLIKQKLNWYDERIDKSLDELVMEGMVWVDEPDQCETLYWFPGLMITSGIPDNIEPCR